MRRVFPCAIFPCAILAGALCAAATGCRKPAEPAPQSLVVLYTDRLPDDPSDPVWNSAPEFNAELIPQDVVDPRVTEPTVSKLQVQAASDGNRLALRLQWHDPSANTSSLMDAFPDACAVQFPARMEASLPAPQMGEAGQPVHITYWNAAWQAMVDGEALSLQTAYPNASVDHYPFQAASLKPGQREQRAMELRYSPARAVNNPVSPPHNRAVQDLVAEGPGTLTAAEATVSEGRGIRSGERWIVVIVRTLPEEFLAFPQPQAAFAVWEGGRQEAGARKMRTAWIPMTRKEPAK